MLVNEQSLSAAFKGFQTIFDESAANTENHYQKISMEATSTGSEETYAWLGAFPGLREWLGDRIVKSLAAHDFTIKNKTFESTVSVKRNSIADDKIGIYKPLFTEMGRTAKIHPDQLTFALLGQGFTSLCYDGQYFFDTDHPVMDSDNKTVSVSNLQAGSGPAWYLLDTNRALKPIIWQEREKYAFQALNKQDDEHVFMKDEYLYGIRARANAGFGLWQFAFASKAALTKANYEAARTAMKSFTDDEGKNLGINPNLLVVPNALEGDARRLLINQNVVEVVNDVPTVVANEWAGTAELLVSPYLV